jgi:hypothetical protein
MHITQQESSDQAQAFTKWRHRNLTRQPADPKKADKHAFAMRVKIDTKLTEMSDERFIAAMTNYEG